MGFSHPEFGSSVNPFTTRESDNAHHITASPPGFENPAAALLLVYIPKASGPIVSLSTLNVLLDSSMVLYFVINSSRLLEIRFHQSDYNVYFYYISEIFDLILPSSLLSSMNSFLLSLIFSSG